jgi:hypothetical protein
MTTKKESARGEAIKRRNRLSTPTKNRDFSSFWLTSKGRSEIKDAILTRREAIHFGKLLDGVRILYIGENHGSRAKVHLAENMRELKAEGVTHLGLDGTTVDNLSKWKQSKTSLRAATMEGILPFPIEPVEEIKKAYDPDARNRAADQIGRLERRALRKGREVEYWKFTKILAELARLRPRNFHWALKINEQLQNPETGKILIFGGVSHVGYSSQKSNANELVMEKGRVVWFFDPETVKDVSDLSPLFIGLLIELQGVTQKPFMFFVDRERWGTDAIIYLPPRQTF